MGRIVEAQPRAREQRSVYTSRMSEGRASIQRLLRVVLWVVFAGCSDDSTLNQEAGDATLAPPPSECGADRPCASNHLCLSGHCFAACSADDQCSTREHCVLTGGQRGACLPAGDGGLMSDPCAGKACFGTTPVCHPTAGVCVACTSDEHCASSTPVCDRGRGVCVERAAELCAPCAANSDCVGGGDAGATAFAALTCVALSAPLEQVCLQGACSADAQCPSAFECLPSLRVCTPRRGTCTAYRAAALQRSCGAQADCSALDAPLASPQSGVCYQAHCAFGCVATPDCPGARICTPPVCEFGPGTSSDAGAAASGI
jgi:hypothetical protein